MGIFGRITLPALALAAALLVLLPEGPARAQSGETDTIGVVVFQTDFGLKDGAVSAMKGVATGVDRVLDLHDITHEIPPFDIWAGAYQLDITAPYWPAGTVFVSVIDPGVGTDRKSVVLRTGSGHYVVTPDNGTLTLIAERLGIDGLREIDETQHRRPGSEQSYTFHGRDVYALTGAKLAAGQIGFADVGPELPPEVTKLPYQKPVVEDDRVLGTIPILDVNFGNVWTNIDRATFEKLGIAKGDEVSVTIRREDEAVFEGRMPYVNTFGDVPQGDPLVYINSVDNVALAINWGSFAEAHGISSGPDWRIEISGP